MNLIPSPSFARRRMPEEREGTEQDMKDGISRRELIGALGRWACAAALGGVVWKLGVRSIRRHVLFGAQGVCVRCAALSACSLPEGIRTRASLARDRERLALDTRARPSDVACPYRRS